MKDHLERRREEGKKREKKSAAKVNFAQDLQSVRRASWQSEEDASKHVVLINDAEEDIWRDMAETNHGAAKKKIQCGTVKWQEV